MVCLPWCCHLLGTDGSHVFVPWFWTSGFGMRGWRACLYTNLILEQAATAVDCRYSNRMNDTITFSPALLGVREGKSFAKFIKVI